MIAEVGARASRVGLRRDLAACCVACACRIAAAAAARLLVLPIQLLYAGCLLTPPTPSPSHPQIFQVFIMKPKDTGSVDLLKPEAEAQVVY